MVRELSFCSLPGQPWLELRQPKHADQGGVERVIEVILLGEVARANSDLRG